MSSDAPAPTPRPPTTALGWQALGLSLATLTCLAFHYGPFLSLAFSLYALVQITREPARHAGRGLAQVAIAVSLIGIAYVVLLGPSFNGSGDMRYGGWLNRGSADKELEANAIGSLRTLQSLEAAYASENGDAVATLECLQKPSACSPPTAADKIYNPYPWPGETVDKNWLVRFHLGAPSANGKIDRYAVTLVRRTPGKGERKALCGDSTGIVLFGTEAVEPKLKDGLCDPALAVVR